MLTFRQNTNIVYKNLLSQSYIEIWILKKNYILENIFGNLNI